MHLSNKLLIDELEKRLSEKNRSADQLEKSALRAIAAGAVKRHANRIHLDEVLLHFVSAFRPSY